MRVRPHPRSNDDGSSGYLRHKVGSASHLRHSTFGEVCPRGVGEVWRLVSGVQGARSLMIPRYAPTLLHPTKRDEDRGGPDEGCPRDGLSRHLPMIPRLLPNRWHGVLYGSHLPARGIILWGGLRDQLAEDLGSRDHTPRGRETGIRRSPTEPPARCR